MAGHIDIRHLLQMHPHSAKMRQRKRKLKPGKPSRANELWYKVELLRIVKLLSSTTITDLTPFFKSETQTFTGDALPTDYFNKIKSTAKRFGNIEAGPKNLQSLRSQLQVSRRKFQGIQTTATRLSRSAVQRNLSATDKQLASHIKQAVGIDIQPALSNDGVREVLASATEANINLITSIPSEYFDKVEDILAKNWETGTRWEELVDLVKQVGSVTESRAKLIARDQTSKMNGAFNMARQTSIGISKYRWQTAGDERVRETHADNDDKVFSWDEPPEETGNPGDDVNCRCVAIPEFDLDEMEADEGISDDDEE